MGTGYNFICRTCRVEYDLGYGSYSSWGNIFADTLAEYQKRLSDSQKELAITKRIEYCWSLHEGHDFQFFGGDDSEEIKDNTLYEIMTTGVEDYVYKIAEHYDQFKQISESELNEIVFGGVI